MDKASKWLSIVSALLYTASIAAAVEKQLLLGAILAGTAAASIIIGVCVQRIHLKRVLGEEEQS